MVSESRFADRLCLFVDHFKQFFVKFANQNFPSVRIFVFRETKVPVYTSSSTICLYLTPKRVKLCSIFLHLDSILAPKSQWGRLQRLSPTFCNYSLIFCGSLLKRYSNPAYWNYQGFLTAWGDLLSFSVPGWTEKITRLWFVRVGPVPKLGLCGCLEK